MPTAGQIIEAKWKALPPGRYLARQVTSDLSAQTVGYHLRRMGVLFEDTRTGRRWIKEKT